MKRQDGVILIDNKEVADTKQCCHCGSHFIITKGSGRLRGWCTSCHAITCGGINCCKCIPFSKRLDLYEAGEIIVL